MPITVTVDTTAAPKVGITITTPDGSAMTSVTLYRVSGLDVEQTRVQPLTGFASRYIEDYAMPWDTPVSYRAEMTYSSGSTAQVSTAVTVTSGRAWAIHPTVPNLSVPIDARIGSVAGISEHSDVTWAATRTLFDVVDSPYPIPIKVGSGARKATSTGIRIRTVTSAEAAAVRALINDQTPILIRVPAVWGWDWEDGYYDVGDVTSTRTVQYGPEPSRTFTLPLQRVTVPAGGQQSNWSYPQLVNDFADYPALRRAFADYPSLLANTRK